MSLLGGITKLASASLDMLYPPRCVGCNSEGRFLCSTCLDSLPRLVAPYCLRCAQPIARGNTCARCLESPLAIDGIRAPFLMEGTIREAVHRVKYNNLRSIAPVLGGLLADFLVLHNLQNSSQQAPARVLVPVPLHRQREKQRGYNQAHLLAKEIGAKLGIAVVPQALFRVSNGPPQAKSSTAQERRANVQGSFRCPNPFLMEGLEVVLVDDVCTTGATLEACALALKEAGAAAVWGLTLARES
ncbi:MAG: ComF family protein [Chloroflexi bacterium]|nr:ComF family protein [Chloroflexota bacterium]